MTPIEIKARLCEAADVLRRLPAPTGPMQFGSSWPEPLLEINESYGYGEARAGANPPQGREIDDAWEAVGWLGYLADRDQRIVWAWANGAPWWRQAQRHRKSERTVQRWFNLAIERISAGLKKKVDSHVRQNIPFQPNGGEVRPIAI